MNFLEAMELVSEGKIVRRKNWLSAEGRSIKIDGWYVMLHVDLVYIFYEDHSPNQPIQLTRQNLISDDWELVHDSYPAALAALKRKHGKT